LVADWPIYYAKDLVVGDLGSNVGVCTLWTERKKVAEGLDKGSYAVCGNLYSIWGINFLVRNILANPKIRYIVLCGADRSGSGQALLDLVDNRIDRGHRVPGSPDRIGGSSDRIGGSKVAIDRQIPWEAVELFRNSVQVIDIRGTTRPEQIRQVIASLKPLPPFAEPQVFPETTPYSDTLPSEKSGFKVEHEKVAGAWLELLRLVMAFGEIKPSEYTSNQKELLNVVAVITHEDPHNPYFAPWFSFGAKELEDYYPLITSREEMPGVNHTYGHRLRNYRGMDYDQIHGIIQRLRRASHTRRAVAVTWDPLVDGDSENPPCLLQLLTSIQSGKLYLTAVFRSHDIYAAWPVNSLALRKLQQEICDALGVELGPMTIVSHSAHIYADNWQTVEELLGKYYPERLAWKDDPRGNFHIYLKNGKIFAEHATTVEGMTGVRVEGKTAREVYLAIINRKLVSLPEHAAYLGSELQKAEMALKLGLEYTQDRNLDWKDVRNERDARAS